MPDIFTKAKRSAVMALIRSRGNKGTELRMMALLRAHGITGWRRQVALRATVGSGKLSVERKSSRMKPGGKTSQHSSLNSQLTRRVSVDFVFRRERVAVFVDGCFWHGCPKHGTMPAGNRAFWKAKLARNAERDTLVTRALRKAGWTVLRIWEHDLAAKHWPRVAGRIARALGRLAERETTRWREFMPRKIRQLVADLESSGFVLVLGGKGSHRKFRHARFSGAVILSGKDGEDAQHYQEKQVRNAIRSTTQ